ncbi:zinc finger SWIM domain-containing protein 7 isoform X2 [Pleurodeles waltl]|uniref:zinc finger SWIM domain-containing protein 7 isoform X2 n=1 Tax=Pleurodeles waltl TaxID=8319 RepID=UPI0037098A19
MGKKPRTSRRSSPWVNRQKHSYLQMSSYVTPFRISPSPLSSYRQCYLKNLSPSVKVLRAAKILQNGNSIACCGRRALKRGEEGFCRDFAQNGQRQDSHLAPQFQRGHLWMLRHILSLHIAGFEKNKTLPACTDWGLTFTWLSPSINH